MSERSDEAMVELRELLEDCLEQASSVSYGHFYGGDPRTFAPDHECSTEAERAAHKAECAEWDAGNGQPFPGPHEPLMNAAGEHIGHVTRCGFGLGTNVLEDPAMADVAERLGRILNRLERE